MIFYPEEQLERQRKSAEKRRQNTKGVKMLDLETGNVIRTFFTPKDAAIWLLNNGYTKSKNPSSFLSTFSLTF